MKNWFYILILTLCGFGAQAQNLTNLAIQYYQEGKFDEAKVLADSAIISNDEVNDPYTWYVRGVIYKEIYKTRENGKLDPGSRPVAVQSFKKCYDLNPSGDNAQNCLTGIKYIATSFFNDAVHNMDTVNFDKTEPSYALYKEYTRVMDPKFDFTRNDKDFYLALGTQVARKFDSKREAVTMEYMERAINIFEKVIAIDSNDCNAHYQIGQMYYNLGVETIMSLKEDTPLEEVVKAQEKCEGLFKKALPHILKAIELRNCRASMKELLKALMGIYWQLNMMDLYEKTQDLYNNTRD